MTDTAGAARPIVADPDQGTHRIRQFGREPVSTDDNNDEGNARDAVDR